MLRYLRHLLLPVRYLQPAGHVCRQIAHLTLRDFGKIHLEVDANGSHREAQYLSSRVSKY